MIFDVESMKKALVEYEVGTEAALTEPGEFMVLVFLSKRQAAANLHPSLPSHCAVEHGVYGRGLSLGPEPLLPF